MALVAERLTAIDPEIMNAAIIGARIIDPKIVDGRIIDGRIIGGRVIQTKHAGTRALRALHIDAEHKHTEIIAIAGLGMAFLLMYLL
jgi:hypothetical protein